MFVEAKNKKTFLEALNSEMRLVIVNLQKFGAVKEILDSEVLQSLAKKRVVFLIDEIHRSHSGDQNEEMVNIFDDSKLHLTNRLIKKRVQEKPDRRFYRRLTTTWRVWWVVSMPKTKTWVPSMPTTCSY
jgi:type I restriction enzyme R subunit